jgi:hypothetical protein
VRFTCISLTVFWLAARATAAPLFVAYDADSRELQRLLREGDSIVFSIHDDRRCGATPLARDIFLAGTPSVTIEEIKRIKLYEVDPLWGAPHSGVYAEIRNMQSLELTR